MEILRARGGVPVHAQEVRAAADWCSDAIGGAGAVREACEWLLRQRGAWPDIIAEFG